MCLDYETGCASIRRIVGKMTHAHNGMSVRCTVICHVHVLTSQTVIVIEGPHSMEWMLGVRLCHVRVLTS
jgi:hypothetical protein